MPSVFSATVSLGSLIQSRRVGTQLSATSVSGRPSRFAGGQRTALGLPSVSGRSRCAIHPGLGVPREQDRELRSRRFGRSGSCLEAHHSASSLATFEATIEREQDGKRRPRKSGRSSKRIQTQSVLPAQPESRRPRAKKRIAVQPPNPSFKRTLSGRLRLPPWSA